jgi:hypothetical protein
MGSRPPVSAVLEGFRPRLLTFVRKRMGKRRPLKRQFSGSSSQFRFGELRKRLPYFNKRISLMVACPLAYGESCRKEPPQEFPVDQA